MSPQLVLNLLVFDEKKQQGVLQHDLIQHGINLGFRAFEVRREYFEDIKKEIPAIRQLADEFELTLFYSVPDEVFVNGQINWKLEAYLIEARQMGATQIKWNIGDFANFTGDLDDLRDLTQQGIAVTVENDQTQVSGRVAAIDTFMSSATQHGLTVGYVYDLGNWRFVGENELQAAEALAKYVTYIHVKDVKEIAGKPAATGLGTGDIDWRQALALLPQDVPVAIEYPTLSDEEILAAKQLLEEEK